MKLDEIKTCVRCGGAYKPTGMNQKYCPICSAATRIERIKKGGEKYRAKVKVALAEYNIKKYSKGE